MRNPKEKTLINYDLVNEMQAKRHPQCCGGMCERESFILRVLAATASIDACDLIYWYFHNGNVIFAVNCNDIFQCGTSDAVYITTENIKLLEDTIQEVSTILNDQKNWTFYSMYLFCARVKKMKPTERFMKSLKIQSDDFLKLFNI